MNSKITREITKSTLVGLFLIQTFIMSLASCGKDSAGEALEAGVTDPILSKPPQGGGQDNQVPTPDPVIMPTISELRWYPTRWQKEWSIKLVNYLDETYLPELNVLDKDLGRLNCRGYNSATIEERKMFWLVFMAAISSQESAFNPKTRYYEDALKEWSEGLFQLSLSDRKPKGGCSLINAQSILTPRANIYCALEIMENQVLGSNRAQRPQGTLFPIRPYYWSVLTRQPAQQRVIEFFKRHLEELPFCA